MKSIICDFAVLLLLFVSISIYLIHKEIEMVKVKFEYRDDYSRGEWRQQECVVNSVEECKKLYGLGIDCEYRIISVEKI